MKNGLRVFWTSVPRRFERYFAEGGVEMRYNPQEAGIEILAKSEDIAEKIENDRIAIHSYIEEILEDRQK